jgi:hypothetical protein
VTAAPVALRPGTRLRSQVCSTEVVVVRSGTGTVRLTCGGHPMVEFGSEVDTRAAIEGLSGGSAIGKRYTAEADPTVEVLVTKAGAGTLADDRTPLVVRQAKPLPASD